MALFIGIRHTYTHTHTHTHPQMGHGIISNSKNENAVHQLGEYKWWLSKPISSGSSGRRSFFHMPNQRICGRYDCTRSICPLLLLYTCKYFQLFYYVPIFSMSISIIDWHECCKRYCYYRTRAKPFCHPPLGYPYFHRTFALVLCTSRLPFLSSNRLKFLTLYLFVTRRSLSPLFMSFIPFSVLVGIKCRPRLWAFGQVKDSFIWFSFHFEIDQIHCKWKALWNHLLGGEKHETCNFDM